MGLSVVTMGDHNFIHKFKANGEYIECDYYVFFIPFHNNKGNCAELYLLSSLQKGVNDVKERIFRQGS